MFYLAYMILCFVVGMVLANEGSTVGRILIYTISGIVALQFGYFISSFMIPPD